MDGALQANKVLTDSRHMQKLWCTVEAVDMWCSAPSLLAQTVSHAPLVFLLKYSNNVGPIQTTGAVRQFVEDICRRPCLNSTGIKGYIAAAGSKTACDLEHITTAEDLEIHKAEHPHGDAMAAQADHSVGLYIPRQILKPSWSSSQQRIAL